MRGRYLNWHALKELKLRWKVSFKALIYRGRALDLLTAEQAKSGFTHLSRKGFTKFEEYDDLLPLEAPMLVQRALDLLDYTSWKKVLVASGLTPECVSGRYLLNIPGFPASTCQNSFRIGERAVGNVTHTGVVVARSISCSGHPAFVSWMTWIPNDEDPQRILPESVRPALYVCCADAPHVPSR